MEQARAWSEYVRTRYRESGFRSYSAFAKSLGMHPQTVFGWLERGVEPSLSMLDRVAEKLDRPIEEVRLAAGYIDEPAQPAEPEPDRPPMFFFEGDKIPVEILPEILEYAMRRAREWEEAQRAKERGEGG